MAPKGLVQPHGLAWKAVFEHGGQEHVVDELMSQEAGQLVCDVLAVKEAVDAGQALNLLQLYTQGAAGRPACLDGATVFAACRAASFADVVQELRACVVQTREDVDVHAVLADVVGGQQAPGMSGYELLRAAAYLGHAATLCLLLPLASPDPARAPPGTVNPLFSPLHAAAHKGHLGIMAALLVSMPVLATIRSGGGGGGLPIHVAAAAFPSADSAAALALLLAAAPETAGALDGRGRSPLESLLCPPRGQLFLRMREERLQAAYVLLAAPASGPAQLVLKLLARCGVAARPLFADAIIPRLPLAEAAWELVPPGCAGLARALPAAVAHSDEQARQLVRRLPAGDGQRLRTAALCLERAQRRARVPLPSPIVQHLLALAFS